MTCVRYLVIALHKVVLHIEYLVIALCNIVVYASNIIIAPQPRAITMYCYNYTLLLHPKCVIILIGYLVIAHCEAE